METKICSKCGRELPLTSYYFYRNKNKCKECCGYKFGKTRKVNSHPIFWTEDKVSLMKQIYQEKTDEEIAKILGTTTHAINTKASRLKLKKNFWWSDKEISLLKLYYSKMNTSELQKLYFKNRSILGIRKKAFEIGIEKDEELIKEIAVKNLGDYTLQGDKNLNYKGIKDVYSMCRNNLSPWIEEIKKKYNYKCAITGTTENLIVHHIKPFRIIFEEELNKYKNNYNFVIYKNIDDYYKNMQGNLLKRFVRDVYLAHKIKDGILINKNIHDEFHNIYGTRYNTEEDFYEFLGIKGVVLL